ncbi:MAG: alanine--tRNA ligase, partial [Halobacteriota archaeon]
MALDEGAYRIDYFEEEGFTRLQCDACGRHFWSRDADVSTCGEPPCAPYTFIDNPGFDERYTLEEMREAFLSFFEEHDHPRIDPYPVAAHRWRDDVLLTQASIYDFQPLVTSGTTPPPANPLCISQPCIRMQDIDNVGKTGRHTMAFEMMAHHAFNAREDLDDPDQYAYQGEVYWKDQTVRYCDAFFASLGADLEGITYIEDPWVGGGNAGPALEVIYEGAELATLVFMSLEQDPDGEYELKDGNRYTEMDTYIVDTGYGLERWVWVSQGTPTIYEAVYPDLVDRLLDDLDLDYDERQRQLLDEAASLAGRLDLEEVDDVESSREAIAADLGVDPGELARMQRPLESVYALADHARALAYMLGDGIVPSNVGAGYLARMVIRRSVRLADDLALETPIVELIDDQAKRLGYRNRSTIRRMVESEVEKYDETLERGTRRVRQLADRYSERGEEIPVEELIELYDSHGIQPETVVDIAAERGVAVTVPDDFFARVADLHETAEVAREETVGRDRVEGLPSTDKLYYDDQERMSFEAVVLDVIETEAGYDIILDQTMFYPEGGGQPADTGTLTDPDATVRVEDVQLVDDVIIHRTDDPLEKGAIVEGRIDQDRRRQLMRNHTATHIVLDSARRELGEHIHQAGAKKGVSASRLDLEHFERLDREAMKAIERRANEVVRRNLFVKQDWPDRHEAEAEHGFDLYQGGIPPGRHIRTIEVGDDIQACGGTHVKRTGDIGLISIDRTERVQDGVERLVFSAGSAAIERMQRREDRLVRAAEILDVTPDEVPETAERFFEAWKSRGKRIDGLAEELAQLRAGADETAERIDLGAFEGVI